MRINCIPVKYLADQHLRAEWVEILMLPAYLKRSIASKEGLKLYEGSEYTLNSGHARFFYDKLAYVKDRYEKIGIEMNKRGYKTNPVLDLSMFPKELFNWWVPTEVDQKNNIDRILTRICEKPLWYTYYGKTFPLGAAKKNGIDYTGASFICWKKNYSDWFPGYIYEFKISNIKKRG